ncbi:MAG: hypothetical protein DGJ47_000905 [Rickettsiaceae bacterium]
MKKILLTSAILLAFSSFAQEENNDLAKPAPALKKPSEFQKVITEYKSYVATVSPEIRDEIIEYRKSIARINKKKILLYKKLSQSAQNYLKKEKQFKTQLPKDERKMISTSALNAENARAESASK